MSEHYRIGDVVRCRGVWADEDDVATDPQNVFFVVRDPSGVDTTYQYGLDSEVVKEGAGRYYVDVEPDAAGTWIYQFYSTGTGKALEEKEFFVARSRIAA